MISFAKSLTFAALLICSQAQNPQQHLRYLDESVDPCDNFYRFSCGNYKKYHEIPEHGSVIDEFALLETELTELAHEILSSPKQIGDPVAVKKAKSAFQSCVSEHNSTILKQPELQIIEEIGGFPLLGSNGPNLTWNDIGKLVGKYGTKLFFDIAPLQISNDMFYLYFSDLSEEKVSLIRPREKSYDDLLEESLKNAVENDSVYKRSFKEQPLKSLLRKIVEKLLEKQAPSYINVSEELDQVLDFMKKLYSGGIHDDDDYIIHYNSYRFFTVDFLQTTTDSIFKKTIDINWKHFLDSFLNYGGVSISESETELYLNFYKVYGILNLVRKTDPKIVKNFVLLRLFYFLSPDSDTYTRTAFSEYYKEINGFEMERWQYCTRKILDIADPVGLSFALAHDYQRYYLNIDKLKRAAEMVKNIQETLKETFSRSDWLDSQTREAALKKAANLHLSLGYPDFADNQSDLDKFYENLGICEWDYYGNARRIRAFRQAYQNSILVAKDTRNYWAYSPMTVNAYYNPQNNRFYLPVGILSDSFFSDDAIFNYGRLGYIIGHEMAHGFDKSGRQFDEDGNYNNWWTQEAQSKFDDRTECFKAQYSKYSLLEFNYTVNGEQTLDENLADNVGIRQSYKAFEKLVQNGKIEDVSNTKYTPEQLFFISYATTFCSEATEDHINNYNRRYAIPEFRIVGALSNFDEFSKAFQCPLGSAMNPENKCVLW